jgi:tRNA(Ile)-lysidine synthase
VKKQDRPISKNRARRSKLAPAVLAAIRRGVYHQPFFRAGDRVGVAVSGGADSVALLHLLLDLRAKLGITLSITHFNHQLRGKASDADEKFVAKLAATLGLDFYVGRANVAANAKLGKLNLEDAGRRARYGFFSKLVAEGKATKIAVAHTADDQAETVLAHILRGSGLAGLGGIHDVSGDIVRPLLGIRRADLRVYLREKKQTWREDATNRDTTKLRSRIRKNLIPLLAKHFQLASVEHLCKLAEFAREDDAHLNRIAELRVGAVCKVSGEGIRINRLELGCRPPCSKLSPGDVVPSSKLRSLSMSRRMVRCIVKEMKPRAGELGAKQVEAVLRMAELGENGKSLQLPGGVEVRRERDDLVFRAVAALRNAARSPEPHAKSDTREFEHTIDFAKHNIVVAVPCLARAFRFTKIDCLQKSEETNLKGSVLNHDALCNPLVLRNWRPGDTFQPLGHRKSHKLKRLLNEARVNRWERDGWPVLTSAGVIAWARGFPVGAAFAATAETQAGVRIEECASSSN